MKKIVIKSLILIILFNFIIGCCNVEATDGLPDTWEKAQAGVGKAIEEGDESGKTDSPGGNKTGVDNANTESTAGAIGGAIAGVVDFIPMVFNMLINKMVSDGGFINYDDAYDATMPKLIKYLTIEKIVFGNYYLFNHNIFSKSDSFELKDIDGNILSSGDGFVGTIDNVKDNIAEWYYICKLIALALGLVTLIYIGIRMALSTIASDRAKYKKMLVSWVQSILIIFILPYIMMLFNYITQVLLNILSTLKANLVTNGSSSFENYIIEEIFGKINECSGMELAAYSFMYWFLVLAEFKFFMMYAKRFLALGFLILISPLITITYSIDKAGDGKAQAFSIWTIEYAINVLIQPLHAALYLVFVFSANNIAHEAPIVGLIFLFSMTRAEKIVKKIFNMQELASLKPMKMFGKDK